MYSTKVKALIVVLVLFLLTGLVSVGCKKKVDAGWVNTASLPGQRFTQHAKSPQQKNSNIVYLGSNGSSRDNFGPSFAFEDLK